MIIKTGKEKDEMIDLKVKKGKIERVSEYKYLGIVINENGTVETHIDKLTKKGIGMMKDVAKMGHECNVGKLSTLIQLFLYEKVVIPSLTYNLEGITHWRKTDVTQLEEAQGKMLKMILKLPDSTPYWGIVNEVGIWSLEDFINYKKLMLFQNLLNAEESRMVKQLIKQQKDYNIEGSWYNQLVDICEEYQIDLENEKILKFKQKWKIYVKKQIKLKITTKADEKKMTMKKLRHQKGQDFCMQAYIKETGIWRIRDIIRVKLELLDIGRNQGEKIVSATDASKLKNRLNTSFTAELFDI